ncbi:hypothetical protein [Sinorhizobium medicae]|uniref:amino acid kinase family protein n=1 Tax=Sinorhizobium medicae TaxID=110321 RepID=UPI003969E5E3
MTILKFGGSNFLGPEGYHRVARHIAQRRAAGLNKIVVVVSAMKGDTDSLIAQILEVNRAERVRTAQLRPNPS